MFSSPPVPAELTCLTLPGRRASDPSLRPSWPCVVPWALDGCYTGERSPVATLHGIQYHIADVIG